MIRILHLVSAMNCGGTENMIMSLYRNRDREKIQFDFLTNSNEKGFFDDEIKSLGGSITETYWSKEIKQEKHEQVYLQQLMK